MPTKPSSRALDLWEGEIVESTGLPPYDHLLWGEVDGAHALISAVRLADGSGAPWPVTAMAASAPADPQPGDRYAVSSSWGGFTPGQIVTRTADDWYVTDARIGAVIALLGDEGKVVQWGGTTWTDRALLSAADQAKIDGLIDPYELTDEEIIAGAATTPGVITAAQAKLAAMTWGQEGSIPQDLDDVPDGEDRVALTPSQLAVLTGASANVVADAIVVRDASGRIRAAPGLDADHLVTLGQLESFGSMAVSIDRCRFAARASAATPLVHSSPASPSVVLLDTEIFDRNSDLTLNDGAVLLAAGVYFIAGVGVFETTAEDLRQPTYTLAIETNAGGTWTAEASLPESQFPAPDADAGKQSLKVTTFAFVTLAGPAYVRLSALSTEDGAVRAGAVMVVEQLKVEISGSGGSSGEAAGDSGDIQLSDGLAGFVRQTGFKIDRTNGVAMLSRISRSFGTLGNPTWTGRATSVVAPVDDYFTVLTVSNGPAPLEEVGGDVVLTVTAPTSFPAGQTGFVETFELLVKNTGSYQMRVVTSGFTAEGAVARQLRLYPGDSGTLRYRWAEGWFCEGVPMQPDRFEVQWDVVANSRIVFPPRGLAMRVPMWTSDVFFLFAPNGGPTGPVSFQWQERVSQIWTTRFTTTFPAGNAFGTTAAATAIQSTNFWGLLAPSNLLGITRVTGGINIGVLTAL